MKMKAILFTIVPFLLWSFCWTHVSVSAWSLIEPGQRQRRGSLFSAKGADGCNDDSSAPTPQFRVKNPLYGDMGPVADVIMKCFYPKARAPGKQLYRLAELNRVQQNFPYYDIENHRMLVAVADGPVGTQKVIAFCDIDNRPPQANRATLCNLRPYLSDLCVDPDYQRMGVAQQLVHTAEAFVRDELGQSEVYIRVEYSNEAAMTMYQKLGYREFHHPDEPNDKTMLLRKELLVNENDECLPGEAESTEERVDAVA